MEPQEKEVLARLTQEYGGNWGINHTRRLLQLIETIGEGLDYDHDVVWTAAHLHDWGAYQPWKRDGIDHALRSGEVAREVLIERGHSPQWIQAVVTCIETHHQGDPNRPVEAILLSDADALDFLGVIGIFRDFSKKPKDMREAYNTVLKRKAQLPGQLCLEKSHQLAAIRIREMEDILTRFEEESAGFF